ncbi:MAG: hypothetical protein U1E77_07305 [Inhella sp.]
MPGPLQLERTPRGRHAQWLRGPDEAPLRRWLHGGAKPAPGAASCAGPALRLAAQADALVASALSATGLEGPRTAWSRA